MKILIDNSYGLETKDRRSPDGQFNEGLYTRKLADEIVRQLKVKGLDAELLVPELNDISSVERIGRINAWCTRLGSKNVCAVSIHINKVSNDGKWHNATGWEAWISPGQTPSDKLADCLYDKAEEVFKPLFPAMPLLIRIDTTDNKKEKFAILNKAKCATVITKNFFQDTKNDIAWLNSNCGFNTIVKAHVEGITFYIDKL